MNPRQQNDQLKPVVPSDERNQQSATNPLTYLHVNANDCEFESARKSSALQPLILANVVSGLPT